MPSRCALPANCVSAPSTGLAMPSGTKRLDEVLFQRPLELVANIGKALKTPPASRWPVAPVRSCVVKVRLLAVSPRRSSRKRWRRVLQPCRARASVCSVSARQRATCVRQVSATVSFSVDRDSISGYDAIDDHADAHRRRAPFDVERWAAGPDAADGDVHAGRRGGEPARPDRARPVAWELVAGADRQSACWRSRCCRSRMPLAGLLKNDACTPTAGSACSMWLYFIEGVDARQRRPWPERGAGSHRGGAVRSCCSPPAPFTFAGACAGLHVRWHRSSHPQPLPAA